MDQQAPTIDAPGARAVCDRCRADADFEIASLWLCIDCYHAAGSTCAGIGRGPTPAPAPNDPNATSDPNATDQVC